MFSCLDGIGLLTYQLYDCQRIQSILKNHFDVFLSINECQKFWRWRSEIFDSTFLCVGSEQEILEYFIKYIEEIDIDPEYVKQLNEETDAYENGK